MLPAKLELLELIEETLNFNTNFEVTGVERFAIIKLYETKLKYI